MNDLVGRVVGRLTVLEFAGVRSRRYFWLCQCSCGRRKAVDGQSIRNGASQSCGCLAREVTSQRQTRHGHTKAAGRTPEYSAWMSMKSRCYEPSQSNFKFYGGRGITVCERWRESFESFLADMGPRPEGQWLDRIDSNGHYEPSNCRWATAQDQQLNKRSNRRVVVAGEEMTVIEAVRRFGVPRHKFYRYLDYGMSVDDIIAGKKHRRRWAKRPEAA